MMRYIILVLILLLPSSIVFAADNPLGAGPMRGGSPGDGNPYKMTVHTPATSGTVAGDDLLLETGDHLLLETDDLMLME